MRVLVQESFGLRIGCSRKENCCIENVSDLQSMNERDEPSRNLSSATVGINDQPEIGKVQMSRCSL